MQTLKLTKQYEKYPEYKNSGVEWLGKIPKDWKAEKIVSVFDFPHDKVTEKNYEPLSVTYDGIKKQLENAAKVAEGSLRKHVKVGDIAINGRSDRKGAVGVSEYEGSVSLVYNVLRKRNPKDNARYFHYLLRSKLFSEEFYRWGRGIVDDLWTTRESEMKRIFISVPPQEDQSRIVNYLDEKIACIDQIIEKKQKQIELLKEKRITVINNAVTKGLDQNVEFVESGVDWIGKIPKGWEIRPVKEFFLIARGRVIPKEEMNDDYLYPVFSSQTENNGRMGNINTYDFDKDALTWTTDGAKAGTVFLRKGKFNCTNVCGILTPKKELDLKYFLHSVQLSATHNKRADTNGYKIMSNEMKNIQIVVPQIDEQEKIAHHIENSLGQYDSFILRAEKSIELLQEFKSSLISNVATGKIKV